MDQQPTKAQSTVAAIVCAACCGLPMLVVLGSVSAGLAMGLAVSLGAAASVIAIAGLVMTRRAPSIPNVTAALLLAAGGASSVIGLVLLADGPNRGARALVVAGIAVLSCLALLRVPATEASAPAPSR